MIAVLGFVCALALETTVLETTVLETPVLEVVLRAPESVVVGDTIRLEFALKNSTNAPLAVREAVLDDRSFAFDVRFDDGTLARFTQHAALPPRVVALGPAQSLAGTLELPALAVGRLTVRPIYLGAEQPIVADERSVTISAKGDLRELGLEIATSAGNVRAQWRLHAAPAASLHIARLALQGRYDAQAIDRVLYRYAVAFGATQLSRPESDASSADALEVARAPLPEDATLALDPSPGKHERGVLTLWRAGRPGEDLSNPTREGAGNGSFFALLADDRFLDGRYSVFARVSSGLDVLDRIAAEAPLASSSGERSRPKNPIRIESVRLSPLEAR